MKQYLFFLFLSIALFSCNRDDDNEAPRIQWVRVNGAEADEHELQAGQLMQVSLKLTDNEELNQVKLNIHAADDGHTHGDDTGEDTGPNTGVWSDTRVLNLEGAEYTGSVNFNIPAEVAGHWHLEVMLIDEEGNEAEEYVTTLHVENDDLPVLEVTTVPAPVDGEISLAPGSSLSVEATASDEEGISEIHIEVLDDGDVLVEEAEFDGLLATSFTAGPHTFTFPSAGEFHLHVKAVDAGGLVVEKELHIHVE